MDRAHCIIEATTQEYQEKSLGVYGSDIIHQQESFQYEYAPLLAYGFPL